MAGRSPIHYTATPKPTSPGTRSRRAGRALHRGPPDLRGYGDSAKPEGGERHVNYPSAPWRQDQVEVMRELGFERFAVVGP